MNTTFNISVKLRRPKPTVIFDTYWRFAAERQRIFFARLNSFLHPWTFDPILRIHKFTNAYRASDRVSQFLIKNVIYSGNQSAREIFFRTILFKIFNKIETWKLMTDSIGDLASISFNPTAYGKILDQAIKSGQRIYSAAYIMPSGGKSAPSGRKHQMHLLLIEKMLSEGLPERITESKTMEEGFKLLLSYPTIGDFLAYQYITDLNYGPRVGFSEMEFVKAGPGARDGIRKCFSDLGDYDESSVIKMVTDSQCEEFARLDLNFKTLWGRPLQLIDCQNLFCEVDKYSRVAHPEVVGLTGRTRIKQKFNPLPSPIEPWYPPKWQLNHLISSERNV